MCEMPLRKTAQAMFLHAQLKGLRRKPVHKNTGSHAVYHAEYNCHEPKN